MTPIPRSHGSCRLALRWVMLSALVLAAGPSGAATYIIEPDGSGDFPTIQAAIDGTTGTDILLLADGVFSGPGNRDLVMDYLLVRIFSQSGQAFSCALDLDGHPLGTNEFGTTEFHDIEIRRGDRLSGHWAATDFFGCVFTEPIKVATPGEGHLGLVDCTITGGSGYLASTGGSGEIELVRCQVSGRGGFSFLFHAQVIRATDCDFNGNASTGYLLRVSEDMGMESCLEATGCEFRNNIAPLGMLYCHDGNLTAQQCTFTANQGPSLVAYALWLTGAPDLTLRVLGCTMSDNQGPQEISVTRSYEESPAVTLSLEHSILAFHEDGCAVACDGEGIATELSCCDIFGNDGGDWTGCIAGHFGADGNIAEDPLFCGGGYGYLLQDLSPCAPGATCAETIGAWPVGCEAAGVSGEEAANARGFSLVVPSPNPSTGRVLFETGANAAAVAGKLRIEIFDVAGRRVAALSVEGAGAAGRIWDGLDASGGPAPAGVYLYRARAAGCAQRGSFVLAR